MALAAGKGSPTPAAWLSYFSGLYKGCKQDAKGAEGLLVQLEDSCLVYSQQVRGAS